LRREGKGVGKWCIWLVHKRHSKRKDWYAPYRERHRNIVVRGYTPKGCSSRRAKMEDKIGGGNICGV